MKQADIRQRVQTILGGQVSGIDTALESSLRKLELNYTFKYMERFVQIKLDPGANHNVRVIEQPPFLKNIEWLRRQNSDSEFVFLRQISPRELLKIENGKPDYYWLDGEEYIWLDKKVEEETTLEMSYARFTAWKSSDNFEPPLYAKAPGLVASEAALHLLPGRDNQRADTIRFLRDEELRSVVGTDADLRYSDYPMRMENFEFGTD